MQDSEIETVVRCEGDFPLFVDKIFSHGFDTFIRGQHIHNTAEILGNNAHTIRISARDHFKSTSLYAHFMYDLIYNVGLECQYFSYNQKMAVYHGAKIKQLIKKNPFYDEIKDLKPLAEGTLKYAWKDKLRDITSLTPQGLLTFKRGVHCPRIYVDDPLRDPDNKLNPLVINKINRIFKVELLSMLTQTGEMHVVGTPQTQFDFFFDKKLNNETGGRFDVRILPAIKNFVTKEVLWKEYMDWDKLMKLKYELGEKIFNQEYLCKPVWTEMAWFSRDKIMSVVNPSLLPKKQQLKDNYVVLGWDLGKKVHPSHISVFEERGINHWVQIYQRFLDGVEYISQVKIVNDVIERLKVDDAGFDATRGEMESFMERNELSSVLKPFTFKTTLKYDMATNFEKMVTNKECELLNDQRQIDQILLVDNDLQALSTPEGHGDSFWSNAIALWLANRKSDESFGEAIY